MPHKGLRGQLKPMLVGLSGYGCWYSVPPWMQPEILLITLSGEWDGLVAAKVACYGSVLAGGLAGEQEQGRCRDYHRPLPRRQGKPETSGCLQEKDS